MAAVCTSGLPSSLQRTMDELSDLILVFDEKQPIEDIEMLQKRVLLYRQRGGLQQSRWAKCYFQKETKTRVDEIDSRLLLSVAKKMGKDLKLELILNAYWMAAADNGQCSTSVSGHLRLQKDFLHDLLWSSALWWKKLEGRNAIRKDIEILCQVQQSVSELGTSDITNAGRTIHNFLLENCPDETIVAWLDLDIGLEFQNLLTFFYRRLKRLENTQGEHPSLHIVVVAHAFITDNFVSLEKVLPEPSVEDVVLYCPWNCLINARVASGIILGKAEPEHRRFHNHKHTPCQHDSLPHRWNSLSWSTHRDIPEILVKPVSRSEEAWRLFKELLEEDGLTHGRRIILPYLCEEEDKPDLPLVSLHVFNFALNFILSALGLRATVHLAASLGRDRRCPPKPDQWQKQYSYREDGITMSSSHIWSDNVKLSDALSMMFNVYGQ